MNHLVKRLLSFAVALVMVLSMVPFSGLEVFAAEAQAYNVSTMTDAEVVNTLVTLINENDEDAISSIFTQLAQEGDRLDTIRDLLYAEFPAEPSYEAVALAETTATVTVYRQVSAAADLTVDGKFYELIDVDINENGSPLENAVTALKNANATSGALILISEGTLVVTNRQDITISNVTIKGAGEDKTVITGNSANFNNSTNGLAASSLSSEYKALIGTSTENVKLMDMTIDAGECGVKKNMFTYADFKTVRINSGTTYLENVTISGTNTRSNLMVGTSSTKASVLAVGVTVEKSAGTWFVTFETATGSSSVLVDSVVEGSVVGAVEGLGAGYYTLTSNDITVYTTIPNAIELYESGVSPEILNQYCTDENVAQGTTVAAAMAADLASGTALYGMSANEMYTLANAFKTVLTELAEDTDTDVSATLAVVEEAIDNNVWNATNAAAYVARVGDTEYTSLAAALEAAKNGGTVTLLTDVDLENKEWTPVDTFSGVLDGAGHTIKNLKITHPGGQTVFDNVGLIGKLAEGTIKDLTIENVNITGSGKVGAVAGNGYTGKIENVTVQGNIQIAGYQYIGGITGYGYASIDNCHVIGDGTQTSVIKKVAGSEIYGSGTNGYVGGIKGFSGEGDIKITNSSVKNITITTNDDTVGGISGIFHYGNTFTGCELSDVVITAPDNDGWNGIIAGDIRTTPGQVSTYEVTVNNVTATADGVALPALGHGATVVNDSSADGVLSGSIHSDQDAAAKIGNVYYLTLAEAINAAKEGNTVQLLPGTISEGTIKLPATLKNVTIKGAANKATTLKDMAITAADGKAFSYEGLTFDGIVFDNTNIVIIGWRDNDVTVKDLTVTNSEFKNIVRSSANEAAVHLNMAETEAVNGFTFTNNVIDGISGASNSGIYGTFTGKTVIENNTFNKVAYRPALIMPVANDGVADEISFSGNTVTNSPVACLHISADVGTDDVKLKVNENVFKDIPNDWYYIFAADFAENTEADFSRNYFEHDIMTYCDMFAYNDYTRNVSDLVEMGLFPYYEDEKKTTLVEAPAAYITGAGGEVTTYESADEAFTAAVSGDTITLLTDAKLLSKHDVKDMTLTVDGTGTLDVNDNLIVHGLTELDISCPMASNQVLLGDGAILKDSTINGNVFVFGNMIFRGDNSVKMLYDFGTLTSNYGAEAPMKWTVEKGASLKITDKARYGFGYGDNITIFGTLEDAMDARQELTEEDASFFTHGIVAQESSGWNCESSMTVKDAYVIIGSNNSFGNKPGNYGGTYTFLFENVVLDGSRITFYEANSTSEFSFVKSDVKVGTFMTNDADSVFTLTDTVLLSTTTTNGSDEGNYNAGKLVLVNSDLTYSAPVVNKGTIELDMNSTITAPQLSGAGKIVIDASDFSGENSTVIMADMSGFTGTVEVTGASYEITENGLVIVESSSAHFETGAYAAHAANKPRDHLSINIHDINVKESLVVKIYDENGVHIATTSLRTTDRDDETSVLIPGKYEKLSMNTVVAGKTAGSWETEWIVAPSVANIPKTFEVYADGILTDTWKDGFTTEAERNDYIALEGVYKAASVTSGETVSYYASLQAAVNAAAEGDTITLLTDITLSEGITVPAGKTVTLDLNGKTVSYNSDVAGEAMITNKGDLTISDSTEEKNGKIIFIYTGTPDATYGKGNYTISNGGSLTLEAGTVENATAKMGHACYAVDNNSSTGAAELTVNGGKILNTNNYAVRQFASGSQTNTITVNGGEVVGTRAVWMQAAGSKAENAPQITLAVNGGKLTGTGEAEGYKLAVYSYSYGDSMENMAVTVTNGEVDGDIALTGGNNKDAVERITITGGTLTDVYSYGADDEAAEAISITGGTFKSNYAEIYALDDGYVFELNEQGTYSVEEGNFEAYYAEGNLYGTVTDILAEAYANGGGTVKLAKDVTVNGRIDVDENVTLDLNGYTLEAAGRVMSLYGNSHIIDSSENCSGVLKVAKKNLYLLSDNKYLPVKTGEGEYHFTYANVGGALTYPAEGKVKAWLWENSASDCFLAQQLADGGKDNDVTIKFRVDYKTAASKETISADFPYSDAFVAQYGNGWGGSLTMVLKNIDSLEELEITPVFCFGDTVEVAGETMIVK